jgi:hypothetical protein
LWDSSWITDHKLKDAVDSSRIVNKKRLKNLRPIVPRDEFAIFIGY